MIARFVCLGLLVALAACNPGSSGGSSAELTAARDEVTTEFEALLERLGAEATLTARERRAAYGSCGSAPAEALNYKEYAVLTRGTVVPDIDEVADLLVAAGWSLDAAPVNSSVEVRNLARGDFTATLRLRADELTLFVTGSCVRVSAEVAAELVGPVD